MRAVAFALVLVACGQPATSSREKRVPDISALSLDEKIGQLFVYPANGTFMNASSPAYQNLLHEVRDNHVGGVIWYQARALETAFYSQQLQRAARVPLLIASDLEPGLGTRGADATIWPSAMAIAATGDTNLARATGRWAAREARLVGINQIYAPVADVSSDPQNPVVNTRSFGEDPQRVGELVAAFVQGVEAEHVLATAKHFPGHGNTRTNSHSALPVIDVSREQLASVELPPFRAAIAAGVSAVMMAHISLPRLEPTGVPASLSRSITTGLLRDELGFRGLIVTDALDMGGVTKGFGPGEAAVRAIEAGADQILKSSDTDAAIAAVKGALRSGRLTEAQIDAAARHVLDAKRKTRFSVSSPDEIVQQLDAGEARAISQDIASRAVTLVREQANQLPLRREQHVVHVRVADAPESLRALDAELTGRLSVPPMSVSVNSTTPLGDVVTATAGADVVLFSYSVETVPPVARELADRLAQQGTPMISVCFGSPYLDVPPAGTYLLAYGSQPVMQIAVARALFGAAPVRGHLPVSIPGPYPVGHGLTK